MVQIDIIIIGNSDYLDFGSIAKTKKRNCKFTKDIVKQRNETHIDHNVYQIGAGKTCLAKRYISDRNDDADENDTKDFSMKQDPTIGVDHFKKTIKVNDQNIKINLWDTAGQDKYFSITKSFFQKADGVILTFDLTDYDSFKKIEEYWLQQVADYSDKQVKKILIGNKVDRQEERKVSALQGADLASKFNINYFETSALTGESVVQSIETLAKQCAFAIQEHRMLQNDDNFVIDPKRPKQMNCFEKMKDISEKFFKMIIPGRKDKNKTPNSNNTNTPSTKQQCTDAVRQQQLQELNKKESDERKSFSETNQ